VTKRREAAAARAPARRRLAWRWITNLLRHIFAYGPGPVRLEPDLALTLMPYHH